MNFSINTSGLLSKKKLGKDNQTELIVSIIVFKIVKGLLIRAINLRKTNVLVEKRDVDAALGVSVTSSLLDVLFVDDLPPKAFEKKVNSLVKQLVLDHNDTHGLQVKLDKVATQALSVYSYRLLLEILEQAALKAKESKKKIIKTPHIALGIIEDEQLHESLLSFGFQAIKYLDNDKEILRAVKYLI